jgi:signal transduction histidine kinase
VSDSLRWQLTVWLGLALGLVLVLFTLAVYSLLARTLTRQIDGSLVARAQQVERAIGRESAFTTRQPLEVELPNTFASADTFVQVSSLDGQVLGRSENLEGAMLPITPEALAALREQTGEFGEAEVGGESLRIYSAPLTLPNHPISAIQVARSLEPTQSTLAQLRLLAGSGLLLAMGLAGLIAWVVVGAALRPLEHIIETSEDIGSSSALSRRVKPTHSSSEVGRLATSFDRMLERLEGSDRALRAAYAKVEASLQVQRRFTADASHELRTPLTSIRGYAGLLRQFAQVTPEDRVAAVAQIDREANRMSRLVEDLLTLARADSGQPLARERVPLAPMLGDIAQQVRALDEGEHTWKLCVDMPILVMGDPDALRQLWLILLDNAMKYTPPGGHIELRSAVYGDCTTIVVADTGIGISSEALPHIFERFYRAHRDRRMSKGTGLGLAIASWIAEEHGGSIEVESSEGRGSTFTVRLPFAAGSSESVSDSSPEILTVP